MASFRHSWIQRLKNCLGVHACALFVFVSFVSASFLSLLLLCPVLFFFFFAPFLTAAKTPGRALLPRFGVNVPNHFCLEEMVLGSPLGCLTILDPGAGSFPLETLELS